MTPGAVLATVAAASVLAWAWRSLPWYKLRGDGEAWRVLLGATLALCALRWFNTVAIADVRLNFIGATVAVLMFGPRFALFVLAAASVSAWAMGAAWGAEWGGWAADFLVCGALPVAATAGLSRLIERRLPAHIFLYVILRGFLGGAAAMAVAQLSKALVARLLEQDAWLAYLAATPPMMFGEGFLCGGTMALIVVYRPHWCSTFDDARYLRGP